MENMTSPGTLLSGDNATWLEEYYQTWLRTPEQLPEDWRRFFLSPDQCLAHAGASARKA